MVASKLRRTGAVGKGLLETILPEKSREISGKMRSARTTIVKYRDCTRLTERSDVLRRWGKFMSETCDATVK